MFHPTVHPVDWALGPRQAETDRATEADWRILEGVEDLHSKYIRSLCYLLHFQESESQSTLELWIFGLSIGNLVS